MMCEGGMHTNTHTANIAECRQGTPRPLSVCTAQRMYTRIRVHVQAGIGPQHYGPGMILLKMEHFASVCPLACGRAGEGFDQTPNLRSPVLACLSQQAHEGASTGTFPSARKYHLTPAAPIHARPVSMSV